MCDVEADAKGLMSTFSNLVKGLIYAYEEDYLLHVEGLMFANAILT